MQQDYHPPPGSPLAGVAHRIAHGGDVVHLNPTGYAAYSSLIKKVCWALRQWCRVEERQSFVRELEPLVSRLATSFELLIQRHARSPVHDLTLDLKDGGFPSVLAIMELAGDLQGAASAIEEGETRALLKEQLLHELLGKGRDPTELLWAISRRVYIRRITEVPVFLPFTFGELSEEKMKPDGRIPCRVTWGYYDSVSSLPFLYHMEFEWSGDRPLSEDKTRLGLLVDALRAESSRSSGVGQLAKVIDLNLPQVHPKAVRRLRIGPLRTARFSLEESPLTRALKGAAAANDFALEIQVDGALSSGEFEPKPTKIGDVVSMFLGSLKPLQRFDIDFGDPVLGAALASFVTPMLLLPHDLVQAITPKGEALKSYPPSGIVTYDDASVYVA